MSAKDKHKAVILLSNVEVHALLETGECSGVPVPKAELEEYGIKFPLVIEVEGFDKHECLKNLKNKIQELKDV